MNDSAGLKLFVLNNLFQSHQPSDPEGGLVGKLGYMEGWMFEGINEWYENYERWRFIKKLVLEGRIYVLY